MHYLRKLLVARLIKSFFLYAICIFFCFIIHNTYNFVNAMLKTEVGKRLKECRLSHNMTQIQVATYLGVAQPVYQRYEKGIYECTYEQIVRLCDLFDISADFFLGRSEI